MSITQKIVVFSLILSFFLPFSGFCQEAPISQPETAEETKNFIIKGFEIIKERMPNAIKNIWQEQVLPIWKKMWDLFKNFWNNYIKSFFSYFWYSFLKPKIQFVIQEVKEFLGQEIEEKKPIIEEELQKEKEKIREEIPTVSKSLWQKLKDLIR